jgi:MFS family permease
MVGISVGAVGVLLGANRLIRIPGNPLAGMLYDRAGRRPLFLLGLLLGTISTAVYGLVRGFWPLLGGRLLWGMAWSLINVGGYMMTLDLSSDAVRGRMIGFYQIAFSLGLFFSPILGGFLTDALGFRSAMLVCATITGIGLLLALGTLPETRATADESDSIRRNPISDKPNRAHSQQHGSHNVPATDSRLNRRLLIIGYIYSVTLFTGGGVLMSTISFYLRERFGDSVSLGGVVLGIASFGGLMLALRSMVAMLTAPTAGYLSDRRGNRWPVIYGGVLVGITGFLVLALKAGVWIVAVGVALVAISSGALIAALVALVGDATLARQRGRAMGRLTAAGDVGSAAGPLLAYALVSVADLRWVYLLCAGVLLSALVAIRRLN